MAKKTRTRTLQTSVAAAIPDALSEIESLRDEMQEWADNMEEKLSHTEKYERVREAADALESAVTDVDVPEFADQTISCVEMLPGRKGLARWKRLSNAVAALSAAKDAMEVQRDELREIDDDEVPAEVAALIGDERTPSEAADELDSVIEEVDNIINEAEGVEFPGMFG